MLLRTTITIAAITVATLVTASQPAIADHRERGWHGDIRHFQTRDLHRWRSGHLGWWWVVAGIWNFFPTPVYPYPNPYVPPTAIRLTATCRSAIARRSPTVIALLVLLCSGKGLLPLRG